jgi:hypothetical protein
LPQSHRRTVSMAIFIHYGLASLCWETHLYRPGVKRFPCAGARGPGDVVFYYVSLESVLCVCWICDIDMDFYLFVPRHKIFTLQIDLCDAKLLCLSLGCCVVHAGMCVCVPREKQWTSRSCSFYWELN